MLGLGNYLWAPGMTLLAIGILLFAGTHLVKALAPALRSDLQRRLGANACKGIFSLLVVAGIGLIIAGWRSTVPQWVFLRYPRARTWSPWRCWSWPSGFDGSEFSSVAPAPGDPPPQLSGVALWGIAHLLLNGDSRGRAAVRRHDRRALVEMAAINHRDGVWIKAGRRSRAPTCSTC